MKYTSCFVGIPLPTRFESEFLAVATEAKRLFPNLRLADTTTPHITVYYLDEQAQEHIDEIAGIVDRQTALLRGTALHVSDIGIFDPEEPRVVYLAVDPGDNLKKFQENIARELHSYNAIDNFLGFTPHITIGKISTAEREDFEKYRAALEKLLQGVDWLFDIEEVSIYGVDSRIQPEKQEKLRHIVVS